MKEYDKELLEDIRQYKDILKRFATLQENDIEGAAFKERVEEMHRYLKEIAVTSRVIWKTAKETLQNYKEI